jgi:hypothetical protein
LAKKLPLSHLYPLFSGHNHLIGHPQKETVLDHAGSVSQAGG